MQCIRSILLLALISCFFASSSLSQDKFIPGFNKDQVEQQIKLEKQFDSFLQADNLRTWLKRLSARPQHIGSPYRKDNAEFIKSLFDSWGYDARIEKFDIYFPVPKIRQLELIEPNVFKTVLVTPAVEGDPVTFMQDEFIPSFNAYSIDGDVTAELVYVNRGVPKDYEELEKRGISVKGKIVISRYGGCFRGVKPKVAAEHGAIGCIIYSDPRDNGYEQGDVYPDGPFRPKEAVERGSVLDMMTAPGDPLTPGVGATQKAKRIDTKDATTITKIPTLPISYENALPLLSALKGPVVPPNWRGGLPITYHFGPGPAKVHLKLEFDWQFVPAYNTIALLKGKENPDEWIIRGNHSDGWVAGAYDPLSGLVALMEEARAVGELTKTGWKPKRTIVYCSWDGEEPGLLGSTEWVEEHAEELREKAVLYINTDSNGRGFLRGNGSTTLENFFNHVAVDVIDPQTNVTLAERAYAQRQVRGGKNISKEFKFSALGSGSDFTPFYQHLGIASMNIGFGGESSGGVGHSIYDTFEYFTRFVDPKFEYGIALAKTGGRIMLRMANIEILPFDFDRFSELLNKYVKEIVDLDKRNHQNVEKENHLIKNGYYKLASDPTKKTVLPKQKSVIPEFDFSPLQRSLEKIERSSNLFKQASDSYQKSGKNLTKKQKIKINEILYKTERTLIREEGLPRRPWYRHFIDAPGFYSGYGAKTIPGVREALEDGKWDDVQIQITKAAEVLERFANQIDKATEIYKNISN